MLKNSLILIALLSFITNSALAENLTGVYGTDLSNLERINFGKTFDNESFDERLTRLETSLYNRKYSNKTISDRLNNLISNTRCEEECENSEQTNNNSNKKISLMDKLKKNLIGEPTGFTPKVRDYSDFNAIGPSYMQGFYGNSGWNNHNNYIPPIRMSF